jgi:hypothetical protein
MSLNPELWIAMAAAALLYHYAATRKLPAQLYVLASVAVSIVSMLVIGQGWVGVLVAQVVLFAVLWGYQRFRKPPKT